MGVLGFTPFIQKTCPEVIKHFPDRLKTFAGKRIVIDGTLITQRLHFAPVPHTHRHIIGWYRLVKELENFGVQAICVFDGKERSTAKAREIMRRRHAQKRAAARGAIEEERLKRLNQLHAVIGQLPRLSASDRNQLSSTLQHEIGRHRASLPDFSDSFWSQHMSSVSFTTGDLVDAPEYDKVDYKSLYSGADRRVSEEEEYAFYQEFFHSNQTSTYTDSPNSSNHEHESDINYQSVSIAPQDQNFHDTLEPTSYKTTDDGSLSSSGPTPQFSNVDPSAPVSPPSESSDPRETTEKTLQETSSSPSDASLSVSTSALPEASIPLTSAVDPLTETGPLPESEKTPKEAVSPSIIERLASSLVSLYVEYRESISKMSSIPFSSQPQGSAANDTEQEAAKSEFEMSRRQYKLTLEEGEVWDRITGNGHDIGSPLEDVQRPGDDSISEEAIGDEGNSVALDPGHEPTIASVSGISEEALLSLAQKSSLMSESYKRSAHPPTTQTYDECKELLSAMGVPCIEATGAYEAEAVASSLVLNGHADYVASEDTDVLIYEAPLIRNITNRNAPLLVLSGAEIRDVLQLTRPMYIDFALLLGTDFSQRIKNVGPARALKFIRAHGSIEKVIEAERKYTPRVPVREYLIQVDAGREVFGTLPPITGEITEEMAKAQLPKDADQKREVDELKTRSVMEKYGLSWALETWTHEDALEGNYFGDNPSSGGNWSSF